MKFIAGLCVLENEKLTLEVAESLKKATEVFASPAKGGLEFVFKASFDKANRTSFDSFRGVGLVEGLRILSVVKEKFNCETITDIHEPEQATLAASKVDHLQIPAFLCRQTDLVIAAAKAMAKKEKGILNIKKGQFLSPQDAKHLVAKASEFLPKNRITITERGVSFGYGQLVVDMTAFKIIRDFGVDVIFDATHSVQMPGKGADGKTTGGNREMIEPLSMAAIAAGASGIFMEVYPDPTKAKSDGPNSYYLDQVPAYLNKICKLNDCIRGINS